MPQRTLLRACRDAGAAEGRTSPALAIPSLALCPRSAAGSAVSDGVDGASRGGRRVGTRTLHPFFPQPEQAVLLTRRQLGKAARGAIPGGRGTGEPFSTDGTGGGKSFLHRRRVNTARAAVGKPHRGDLRLALRRAQRRAISDWVSVHRESTLTNDGRFATATFRLPQCPPLPTSGVALPSRKSRPRAVPGLAGAARGSERHARVDAGNAVRRPRRCPTRPSAP